MYYGNTLLGNQTQEKRYRDKRNKGKYYAYKYTHKKLEIPIT